MCVCEPLRRRTRRHAHRAVTDIAHAAGTARIKEVRTGEVRGRGRAHVAGCAGGRVRERSELGRTRKRGRGC